MKFDESNVKFTDFVTITFERYISIFLWSARFFDACGTVCTGFCYFYYTERSICWKYFFTFQHCRSAISHGPIIRIFYIVSTVFYIRGIKWKYFPKCITFIEGYRWKPCSVILSFNLMYRKYFALLLCHRITSDYLSRKIEKKDNEKFHGNP